MDSKPIGGVANIGNRPTVNGVRQQLEVHLFDFQANLYGKQLEIVLIHKIRDEHKFDSFEALNNKLNWMLKQQGCGCVSVIAMASPPFGIMSNIRPTQRN